MAREFLNLREHLPLRDVALSAATARSLARSRAIDVAPSTTSEGWTLRAKQFVGIVQTEDVELRIQPKIPVGNVLFLVAFAQDQRGWRNLVTTLDTSKDLVSAIAMGFVHHTSRALQQGVIQGYVSRDEALHTVRGRIRTADQFARRFGLPLPVEITFDDFTPDVLENRILRSALQRIMAMSGVPASTVRQARHQYAQLEGVTLLPSRGSGNEVTFNRLNERYRPAVTLGNIILRAESLAFSDGATSTTGFLFDMNRVFEDFISVALTPLFRRSGLSLESQRTDYLDEGMAIQLRPDLTWWRGGVCLGVADIKYKSLATKELPNADVYQALAYCIAHRVPEGHLIYAAGNEHPASYTVRHHGVTIQVHALDLSRDPSTVLAEVGILFRRLLSPQRQSLAS